MNTTPRDPTFDRSAYEARLPAPSAPSFKGSADIPLSQAPTAALVFALGAAVASPQKANRFGPFCAMVEELSRRTVPGVQAEAVQSALGAWDSSTELGALVAVLPPELASQVSVLYSTMRGQRWAATGSPNSR